MEDILALVVVLAMVGVFWFTLSKMLSWRKARIAEKQKKQEEADKYWAKQREQRYSPSQWAPVTPQQYADAMPTPKRKPAMKKANVSSSYVNTPMTSTSSTSTAAVADDGFFNGVMTGVLIDSVVNSLPHKSGGSDPIDFPKSSSSWGLDDSDSRKSISDSMDTSSSWSSSDSSSSSDSGPSSDW